jgi:hypothetical protein
MSANGWTPLTGKWLRRFWQGLLGMGVLAVAVVVWYLWPLIAIYLTGVVLAAAALHRSGRE